MAGINKVIVLGNLGQDPETTYMPSGDAVTNISIATSEKWKDKATGQDKERTEWHRVVFFGKLAEIASQYLRKGSKVYIEGQLRTRKWQDQSGADRYSTEIVCDMKGTMQMLDSKQDGQQAQPAQQAYQQPQQAPQQQQAPQGYQQQAPQQQNMQPPSQAQPYGGGVNDPNSPPF